MLRWRGGEEKVAVSETGHPTLQALPAETAKAWREYAPQYVPLPYPSPRNQPWFKHHPWFERQLVPTLRARIKALSAR